LTPQFTTNGPKSNRNNIRVLSGLTVWIISWRIIDIGDTTSFLTFSKFYSTKYKYKLAFALAINE
jgi:hypothetical protein